MNSDRKRQDRRQAELDRLDALMRKPGTLPSLPVPVPLHKMGGRDQRPPRHGDR